MSKKNLKNISGSSGSGAVYGIGFIGAVIYFIQRSDTFGEGVVGIIKAIFWPGFLVYKALDLLSM